MHPLSPEETGSDTFYTLKTSLYEAGIKPSEIDMVNCHASSTIVGDISEARGVRKILNHKRARNDLEVLNKLEPNEVTEDDLDDTLSQNTVITASKPNLGHSQICAGSVETIMAVMSFQENIVPHVRNLEVPCVNGLNFVMKKSVERKINILAKTCFGFGSSCSSLIFKRFE
jgi:3-oxoacyl-[acyl-carrier-protein] synthase II